MPDTNLCEIIVLLDRSGSMSSIRADMEGGFNRFIDEQKAIPGACVLTLVQFDSHGIDTVLEAKPIAEVPALRLEPRGSTPLLDAMGQTINRVGNRFALQPDDKRPGRVLFLVITDGQEKASHEFKREQIKTLVERQTKDYQWTFSFLGANLDSFAEANSLGIGAASTSNYTPNSAGVGAVYASLSSSTKNFRERGTFALTDEQRKKMAAKPQTP